MKKILIAILCAIIAIAGIVAVNITINNKKHLQSDFMLAQLKYGMTLDEITSIVGDLGLSRGSGRLIFTPKLPDGRRVIFLDNFLKEIRVEENKGDFSGYLFEYDLDKQELIMPFTPDSLIGVQYGMTVEEIEKIFLGNSQLNVSFFGGGRSRKIALGSFYLDIEPNLSINVTMIRLSTGEWVNMGFELLLNEPKVLLYVYMKADDGKWYVYDLDTQKLTEERVPKERVWEGHE
jgi:uncharacterized membrane protein YciS (DUF1049 family)